MNGGKILNITDDTSNQSATTKSYQDTKFRNKVDSLATISTTTPMITDIDLNGRKCINSGLAVNPADLVPLS